MCFLAGILPDARSLLSLRHVADETKQRTVRFPAHYRQTEN
jgi:hypothetical protein